MPTEHLKLEGAPGGPLGPLGSCTGTPEDVAKCEKSYTGQYLKRMLEGYEK